MLIIRSQALDALTDPVDSIERLLLDASAYIVRMEATIGA